MNKKGLANIIFIIFIIGIITLAGYFILYLKGSSVPSYSVSADNIFTSNIGGYYETCRDKAIIYKRANNSWEQISDNLPGKGGYYLDDKFVGYGWCDNIVCNELPKPYTISLAENKVVGAKPPPSDSGFVGLDAALMYQTVPLRGDVKIEIQYFSDKNCKNKKTFSTVLKRG